MEADTKKRVGVLRGGPGKHYHFSLKKGGGVLSHITEHLSDKYKTFDIFIDKNHIWHLNGKPINPSDLMSKVDLIWNTAHPSLSNVLKSLSIPHVGAGLFHSILEHSTDILRDHMKKVGVEMPKRVVLAAYQEDFDGPREKYAMKKAKEIFEKFSSPWIVKSYTEEANMGIHLAKTFPELVHSIDDGVKHGKSILIEEFIDGKIATVHSVPHFRGEDIYIFPIATVYGMIMPEERTKLTSVVRDIHGHLGTTHYLKTDFVIHPRGKMYLLGVDSVPDLQKDSHFHYTCESVGAKMHHVVEHILEHA